MSVLSGIRGAGAFANQLTVNNSARHEVDEIPAASLRREQISFRTDSKYSTHPRVTVPAALYCPCRVPILIP